MPGLSYHFVGFVMQRLKYFMSDGEKIWTEHVIYFNILIH